MWTYDIVGMMYMSSHTISYTICIYTIMYDIICDVVGQSAGPSLQGAERYHLERAEGEQTAERGDRQLWRQLL